MGAEEGDMQLPDNQIFVVTRIAGERGAITFLIIDSGFPWQVIEVVFPLRPQSRRRLTVERCDLPEQHLVSVPRRRRAVDAVQIQGCGARVSYSPPNLL